MGSDDEGGGGRRGCRLIKLLLPLSPPPADVVVVTFSVVNERPKLDLFTSTTVVAVVDEEGLGVALDLEKSSVFQPDSLLPPPVVPELVMDDEMSPD